MLTSSRRFFDKYIAGLMSALLGAFVLLSCCAPFTPDCCQKEEALKPQLQNAKLAFVAVPCCMEQDEHSFIPLSPAPKLKLIGSLNTPEPIQFFPPESLSTTQSLTQQVFYKDQSRRRYLELGVFLS